MVTPFRLLLFPFGTRGMTASVLLAGMFTAGAGESSEGPRLTDLLDQAQHHRRPLSDFMGPDGDKWEVEIALNSRIEVVGGEIEVQLDGPLPGDAQLQMTWDGQVLATSQAHGPGGGIEKISGRFSGSKEGINSHRLKVAVEPADSGEPLPASLSQIDPAASWIALEYRLRPIEPLLDELRDLIDERLWTDAGLTIVTPPLYAAADRHFEWGSRIAQRAALWHRQRTLRIGHADHLSKGRDEIVAGSRDELIGLLPKAISDQITSSFVGVYPHPEDNRHFLLVLSGTDAEGVDRAVRAFAFAPDRLPSLARLDVTGWEEAARDPDPLLTEGSRTGRLTLPDLELWTAGRVPSDLWVTARESGALASAWMLAGRLAQTSGDMVPASRVTLSQPESGRHWIAIGPRGTLSAEIADASPLSRLTFTENDGILAQFESPFRTGDAAGFLTAEDSLLLQDRVAELIRPESWDAIRGDTVTWNGTAGSANHQRLAATFVTGDLDWLAAAWEGFASVPWLSLFITLFGAIAIYWLATRPMTSGRDWDVVATARANSNRRVSRARRQREVARREARRLDAQRRHLFSTSS
jgi:hypothetical protein